jgi:hypothetical protein
MEILIAISLLVNLVLIIAYLLQGMKLKNLKHELEIKYAFEQQMWEDIDIMMDDLEEFKITDKEESKSEDNG